MTPRNWRMRVEDILDAIAKVERYTAGMAHETFVADERTADAVIWNVGIIGEATRHIPPEVQARYPAIPWPKVRSMRNVLIHDYPRINLTVVWQTIQNDLSPLVPQLRQILEREQ